MGSCEEYSSSLPETPSQTQPESPSRFNLDTLLSDLYPGTEKEEESLVEGLKSVSLEENDRNSYGDNNNGSENLQAEWEDGENYQYPLRPCAEDCSFFLKTGTCKFGLNCKFNHPVGRGFQDEENYKGWTAEQTGRIECKYYRATGGCKYGNACRYRHCNEDYVLAPLEANSFGLPVQVLEKECPYYMRTGSCGYGASCRFNHPDPTSAEGSNTFSSDPSGFGGHSSENYNGESDALPSSPKPTAASSSLNMMSDKHVPYLNHNSSSAHVTHLNSEWNGHEEKTSHPYSSRSIHSAMKTEDISKLHQEPIQVDEFPERPGEPECPYFMKTGYCKFKTACKFHHPKIRSSKPTAFILSSAGLPLRPDRKICWNYEKFGVCKYGRSCYFHHPENLFSSDFWVDSIP
ncbi:zinc finger CCCH domain-containing protein 43-like isoform X2 [Durio zibethinus]|uniref:Zinc finger CCCH domain-containing protein 43-like isoform X2 n=1 Tax=Durio zibethinus TaxID=66656 RepID=A0A6P5YKZ3_DURZI|nr:zinc finger CCCH domain-containing protein 43-like isoform X2 [Durio zibethinus]